MWHDKGFPCKLNVFFSMSTFRKDYLNLEEVQRVNKIVSRRNV